jgi:hypothetical protein
MRNWGMIVVGGFLVLIGLMSVISAIFDVNLSSICWPTLLILVGVLLLVGPRIGFPGENVQLRPLADIKRRDAWQVTDEEIWTFVGDVRLDFSQADIPPGVTTIRLVGFVGDVNLYIPEGFNYSISSTAFLTDIKVLGKKRQVFVSTLLEESEGYQSAESKIRLEMLYFVNDLDIRPS